MADTFVQIPYRFPSIAIRGSSRLAPDLAGSGGGSGVIDPPTTGQLWPRSVTRLVEGGGSFTRTTATYTTGSLVASGQETGVVALAAGYRLYVVSTDRPARVRLYATVAYRDADASRPKGTDPSGDHGVVLEVITASDLLEVTLAPVVNGAVLDGGGSMVPITVDNLDSTTGTVTVTIDYLRTE